MESKHKAERKANEGDANKKQNKRIDKLYVIFNGKLKVYSSARGWHWNFAGEGEKCDYVVVFNEDMRITYMNVPAKEIIYFYKQKPAN